MSNKVALQARIDEDVDLQLRQIAAKHRKRPNVIVDAALRHCFSNRHFLSKLEELFTKKEEEIDY
ncbi:MULTISPECIES: hypothetical protein [Pseudanabaena]|uniref:CopG-like domain-containing protein DNA-binding n=2 Tax=Pseudanabaena TaxID=1152 RepID=L8MXS2_9CYAN|nr:MULTISPECIES: hypothetical protein [Pseudanabaena]ELS32797.1 hypothetical protein Pse7429DRAFT_2002 [Pseudanabaena biceps PCC 7429]MDG3494984.1 hypothetical protein [Pseudanabaena catenata USMAC16]